MDALFDCDAPKKATNLSVNSDLLRRSRELKINLSATLEQALRTKLAEQAAEQWQRDNKKAIQAYNDFVDKHGCFGDDFRSF